MDLDEIDKRSDEINDRMAQANGEIVAAAQVLIQCRADFNELLASIKMAILKGEMVVYGKPK